MERWNESVRSKNADAGKNNNGGVRRKKKSKI
jgi:hypothetical protein